MFIAMASLVSVIFPLRCRLPALPLDPCDLSPLLQVASRQASALHSGGVSVGRQADEHSHSIQNFNIITMGLKDYWSSGAAHAGRLAAPLLISHPWVESKVWPQIKKHESRFKMVLTPADIAQITNALKPQFDKIDARFDEILQVLEISEIRQHNCRISPLDTPKQLPQPPGVHQAPEQPTCLAQIMVSYMNRACDMSDETLLFPSFYRWVERK